MGGRRRSSARLTALALPVVDLSRLPAAEREAEARRLADTEARRPFDLARGRSAARALLRLAADDHVLLLTMHHIVSDGWSMGVLVSESDALYEAFREGRPRRCPSCRFSTPTSPTGSGVAQGEVLSAARLLEAAAAGAPAVLELPTDRPRPPRRPSAARSYPLACPSADRGAQALSRREGATLFMTLLAAFQTSAHATRARRTSSSARRSPAATAARSKG